MIVSTGIDIIEIKRLTASIQRYGSHFLDRVYTAREQQAAPNSELARGAYFAGRWAVKEAVSKALGTGIGASCAMTDVEITNDAAGAPVLTLHGAARKTAAERGIARFHISISHEREYAIGQAIAEA